MTPRLYAKTEPDLRAARRADPAYTTCPKCLGAPRGCAHCLSWGSVLRDSLDASCVHVWRSERIGHCLHRDTCTRCGSSRERDSSG